MTGEDRVIFQKIIGYSNDLLQYVNGLDFETFMIDKRTISACAFTLSQIGEISKFISTETQLRSNTKIFSGIA